MAWVNSSTGNVVLEWTAVGDDRDWGRALRYEGISNPSREITGRKCTGPRLEGLPTPSVAGSKEYVVIKLKVNDKVSLNKIQVF